MIELKVDELTKAGTLRLDGEVKIEASSELKKVLLDHMDKIEELKIEFGSDFEADISFLQLVCAVHKSLAGTEKKVSLSGEISESLKSFVKSAGFWRSKECNKGCNDICLWTGGE